MIPETPTERVSRLAEANGITLDASDAAHRIAQSHAAFTSGTHTFLDDAEITPLLVLLVGQANPAPLPVGVHPVNANVRGVDPAFLASLNALAWDTLSTTNKVTLTRQCEARGTAVSQADRLANEYEAKALAGLQAGRGAVLSQDGRIRPDNLSAADKIRIFRAEQGLPGVVITGKRAPLGMADLPSAVSGILDPVKRAQAVSRVQAADVAKVALASGKNLSAVERNRLIDTIAQGFGGSLRVAK